MGKPEWDEADTCPWTEGDPDACAYCSGEACALCLGAGLNFGSNHFVCSHDIFERHPAPHVRVEFREGGYDVMALFDA